MSVYRFPIPTLFANNLNGARPTTGVRLDVQRLMDDVFAPTVAAATPRSVRPAVDARENAKGFTLEIEVPGIAPDAIDVLAEDGVLTIRGTPVKRELEEGETLVLSERNVTSFERKFRLPKTADSGTISASYANGVLQVHVAKLAPVQPKRVTVNVDAGR